MNLVYPHSGPYPGLPEVSPTVIGDIYYAQQEQGATGWGVAVAGQFRDAQPELAAAVSAHAMKEVAVFGPNFVKASLARALITYCALEAQELLDARFRLAGGTQLRPSAPLLHVSRGILTAIGRSQADTAGGVAEWRKNTRDTLRREQHYLSVTLGGHENAMRGRYPRETAAIEASLNAELLVFAALRHRTKVHWLDWEHEQSGPHFSGMPPVRLGTYRAVREAPRANRHAWKDGIAKRIAAAHPALHVLMTMDAEQIKKVYGTDAVGAYFTAGLTIFSALDRQATADTPKQLLDRSVSGLPAVGAELFEELSTQDLSDVSQRDTAIGRLYNEQPILWEVLHCMSRERRAQAGNHVARAVTTGGLRVFTALRYSSELAWRNQNQQP